MKKDIRTKLISLALASCMSVSLMACNKSDSEDDLIIFRLNGNWYLSGNYW